MKGDRVVFIKLFTSKSIHCTPPLGIASLIYYLKKEGISLSFDVYDMFLDGDPLPAIYKKYNEGPPRLFGISGFYTDYCALKDISSRLKRLFPKTPIVVGGPIVTSLMDRIMELNNIDFAIYKEGEIPLTILIRQILSGKINPQKIPSLIYREDGAVKINPFSEAILPEGDIPLYDTEEIHINRYFKHYGFTLFGIRPYLPLITSRGCPYHCTYCHGIFGRKVRYIPEEKVINFSIEFLKKYKASVVEIYDDIFNLNEDRAKRIIKGIISHLPKTRFEYPNGFRTDILSDEFINFLGEHNTEYLSVAVESASPRIQKMIRKRLDLERLKKNVKALAKHHIFLHGYFMMGFPTETEKEIEETISFAREIMINTASFFIVTPHPGTELFESLPFEIKRKIENLPPTDLRYYSHKYNISEVNYLKLKYLHKKAFLSFYFYIPRLYRIIRDIPDILTLINGSIRFFKILVGRHGA